MTNTITQEMKNEIMREEWTEMIREVMEEENRPIKTLKVSEPSGADAYPEHYYHYKRQEETREFMMA